MSHRKQEDKLANYPLLEVHWRDSCSFSTSSWRPASDHSERESLPCRSVGYLVGETTGSITLAGHVALHNGDQEPDFCGEMTIPKKTIISKKHLHLEKRRRRQK